MEKCKMGNVKCKMKETAAKPLRNFTLFTLHFTLAIAATAAMAENAAPIVAETLFEDGSTNTWTQADLTDALGLMNRKYHRDIETESGRVKWHGKRMGQYVIDVDLETGGFERGPALVSLYEDGFAWTNKGTRVTLKDPEAAAKARAAAEARQAEWERANLPPDVADLLQRRRAAQNGEP